MWNVIADIQLAHAQETITATVGYLRVTRLSVAGMMAKCVEDSEPARELAAIHQQLSDVIAWAEQRESAVAVPNVPAAKPESETAEGATVH